MEDARAKGGAFSLRLFGSRAAAWLLPAFFFTYVFFMCLNLSLNDPDVWWHLKTGEYVVSNWEVPDVDPFAYTTPRPLSPYQKIGLQNQWLGQVLFYSSYYLGGLLGVGLFRNFLIILPMGLLYIWLRRRGMATLESIVVVSFPTLIYAIQLFYTFERPQAFSFIYSLVVLMLLERLRRTTRVEGPQTRFDVSWALLPLVTAVWSNTHAGFMVGNFFVMIYMAGEIASTLYRRLRRRPAATGLRFYMVASAALLGSGLNPNGFDIFWNNLIAFGGRFFKQVTTGAPPAQAWVESVVLEFKPLVYFYTELLYDWLIFYWLFTAILLLALIAKYAINRRVDLAELVSVCFIAFLSNYYARGLMFSFVAFPFFAGRTLLDPGFRAFWRKAFSKAFILLMLAVSVGFGIYSYRESPEVFRPTFYEPEWITPWFPVRAVEFLSETKIPGPMYNYYTWGGFLIWSMYPEYRVFIDGRALDDNINQTADSILKTYPDWKTQLDVYGVNFIIIPTIFRESGHIIPLATALVDEPEWKLVFIKNNSAIFVRDVPRNRDLIYTNNIDKNRVYDEIIDVENILLSTAPNNPVFNISKAEALFALGRYAEAKALFERFPVEGQAGMIMLRRKGY